MDKVEIGRSRSKTFLLILGAIAFVAAGLGMIYASDTDMFEKVIGGISILFFGAAIPIGIKKLIKNEIAIELNAKKLIIEPKSSKRLSLAWDKIQGFDVIKISGTKIIIILVNEPEEWIEKETNSVKRNLMQFNLNNYGSPFNITSTGLAVSHYSLLDLLNEYQGKYNLKK
ncbi:STM3941 family protein [Aureicoccus marinus]|uniref:Uncharacterized protein n=1 Tax=Aureicoccus marinus TaxID=754435 RepID=A0A2S7T918_9FLAO|nr:STM3941 family protein [Aureicoccus marinus]PQJ15956.1 hypothetical protein BST99_09660 [Aureicoccus marinus]